MIAGMVFLYNVHTHSMTTPTYSTIVAAAQLLPPSPDYSHLSNLSDWLNALNLSYLEAKFILNGYSNLKRVSKIQPWDIDLLSVSSHMTSHDQASFML